MKRALLLGLLLCAVGLFAQNNPVTAEYPDPIDDTHLGVYADRAYSTLAEPVTTSSTTLTLVDGSRFPDAEHWVVVCPLSQCGIGASASAAEMIFITGKASTHVLTIGATGRQVLADQTGTATGGSNPAHAIGEAVVLVPAAGQLNRMLAEWKELHDAAAGAGPGGGGSISQAGTYADLSSVMGMSEGDVYYFDQSDTPYTHAVYNGTSWDLWYFGRKCTPFVPGDYSWVNQVGASYASYGGATVITTPGRGAYAYVSGLVKSQPSTPYTITVLFSHWEPAAGGNHSFAGPLWRESSFGSLHTWGVQDQYINSSSWTSPTAFFNDYSAGNVIDRGPLFLARIRRDSGRFTELAIDPLAPTAWISYGATTDTNFLDPDQVGFFVNNAPTGGTATSYTTILSWEEN